MTKLDIKSLDLVELKEEIIKMEEKPFHANQIYDWLHKKLAVSFDKMSNIPKALKVKLDEKYEVINLEPVETLTSSIDGTIKFLFRLHDGNVIESVLMRYKHGNSVCISTQAGCRMGCRFCASAIGGLTRNLYPSEMADQIYKISVITGERISNIVLMGTGEPLDNYDNVLKFIKMISDENGLHISQRNITISTCGIVPNIHRLAEEDLQITLAVSLHASNNDTRRELMPIANKYTIEEIIKACKYYFEKTKRRLTFEYSLVSGVNDTTGDAKMLSKLLYGINCHVNLIPINPIKERDYRQTDQEGVNRFKNYLLTHGINATVRREMGRDIQGACGQLRKNHSDITSG
jgi:23S rRNA (adenine2503-C2)-methyltransferase